MDQSLTFLLGHLVGIVANQVPVINPDEASKGTQFIRLCNQQYVFLLMDADSTSLIRSAELGVSQSSFCTM